MSADAPFPRKAYKLTAGDRKFLSDMRISTDDGRLQGRRLEGDILPHTLAPGEYGRDALGTWYGMTPNGLLANLSNHKLTEHAGGVLTVEPSIYVNRGRNPEWHGFLIAGVWSAC
jgi:hypothetical protein